MRHLARALVVGGARFGPHNCTQAAAALAYSVLFSIFPFAILLVSIAGLVLRDERRRERLVDWLLEQFPLSGSAADDLARAVDGVASPASLAGFVAIVGVLWSASGMIGTIRSTIARIWGAQGERHFVASKALDLTVAFGMALFVLAAFGLTVVVQALAGVATDVADEVGLPAAEEISGHLLRLITSVGIAFVVILVVYRVFPPVEVHARDLWPAALFAAVALQAATIGFGFYLRHVADFNVVYGSLGVVIGFLLFVYFVGVLLFLGAEVAAAWPEAARPVAASDPEQPLPRRLLATVKALLGRAEQPVRRKHVGDEASSTDEAPRSP